MGEEADQFGIVIAPPLVQYVTQRDLIAAEGSMVFWVSPGAGTDGMMFEVVAPGYRLRLDGASTLLRLTRNDFEASAQIPEAAGLVMCHASWTIDSLKVQVLHGDSDSSMSMESDETDTSPRPPPIGLLNWSRAQNVAPKITYPNVVHFYNEVVSAFQAAGAKVLEKGAQRAFWDNAREGGRIVSRRPKSEPDVQPTVDALLYDLALAKNFEVIREGAAGSGNLDFTLVGSMESGKLETVAVELKNAHSGDVRIGVRSQLPTYMSLKGAELGLYVVLWYKGRHFDKPAAYEDMTKLHIQLLGEVARAGYAEKIRVLILDLSHPLPPSER